MASKSQEYYENEENHGDYVYVTLEEMVNNFIANYTGDGTILGKLDAQKSYSIQTRIKEIYHECFARVKAWSLERYTRYYTSS
jgi:hypothetical protein